MFLSVYDTEQQVAGWAARRIARLYREKPDALLCIAAGHSSIGVFRALERSGADFSRGWFAAMDEWSGMNEHTPGSCGDFLRRHFLANAGFDESRVRLMDGAAADLEAECEAHRRFIQARGGFDLILLGLGMNGHLALNEPGVDPEQSVHVTELDAVTKRVGTKYFDAPPALQGGVTIGIADIRAAGQALLCVTGGHKREILARMMVGPITPALPASLLRAMPNASAACDRAAAGPLAGGTGREG